jgi:hypothetical protein
MLECSMARDHEPDALRTVRTEAQLSAVEQVLVAVLVSAIVKELRTLTQQTRKTAA